LQNFERNGIGIAELERNGMDVAELEQNCHGQYLDGTGLEVSRPCSSSFSGPGPTPIVNSDCNFVPPSTSNGVEPDAVPCIGSYQRSELGNKCRIAGKARSLRRSGVSSQQPSLHAAPSIVPIPSTSPSPAQKLKLELALSRQHGSLLKRSINDVEQLFPPESSPSLA
jgi:hypothetical protein